MKFMKLAAITGLALFAASSAATASDEKMSFFVTSVNPGDGGNLGGLEGADAYCTKLAEAAGVTGKTWRAYLSTQEEGKRGISARDRIGDGPWFNANGEVIANNLDELHLNPHIVKATAVDENGNLVNGRGDSPKSA